MASGIGQDALVDFRSLPILATNGGGTCLNFSPFVDGTHPNSLVHVQMNMLAASVLETGGFHNTGRPIWVSPLVGQCPFHPRHGDRGRGTHAHRRHRGQRIGGHLHLRMDENARDAGGNLVLATVHFAYAAGAWVIPDLYHPYLFQAQNSGTSSSTAGSFPASVGSVYAQGSTPNVTDNGITWAAFQGGQILQPAHPDRHQLASTYTVQSGDAGWNIGCIIKAQNSVGIAYGATSFCTVSSLIAPTVNSTSRHLDHHHFGRIGGTHRRRHSLHARLV